MKKIIKKRSKLFFTWSIFLFSVFVIFAIFRAYNSDAEDNQITESPLVKLFPVQEADENVSLEISGFIRGENRADVAPLVSGKILNIFKREGDFVKQGEVIAIIDSSQVNAQISAANLNIDALEKTLKDSKKYYDQLVDEAKAADDEVGTDTSYEAVKSAKRARDLQIQSMTDQLVSAQGMLQVVQSEKNNFSVTAPFSGKVTAVLGRVGGFASFGTPLVNVSSDNNFEIETYVSSLEGQKIIVGNTAKFFAKDDVSISGIVSAVSAGADSQSLKTLVRIHLDDAEKNLKLGDFLHGEVIIPKKNSMLLIPASAVVSRGGDAVVFVVDEDNRAVEHSVKLGGVKNGMVDVLEGISANQNIVVEGQQYLINGIIVKIYATGN
ncbi:MAG: efflux RND transporter periplasmic adaptor subunit [Candidatus Moranbacteria bacterium]|jgi:RND family efflux transporter MFP subunit|nr:efflux RND transporter periplasmic adaptor subunit [Candidatus Moranbacteria bacterium]